MLSRSFRKSPLDVCSNRDQVLSDNMKTIDITTRQMKCSDRSDGMMRMVQQ